MLELLLANKKKVTPPLVDPSGYLYCLDFTSAALGSKKLTDISPSKIDLPAIGTTTDSTFGVVDLAGVGRCFQFNGAAYFYSASNLLNNISTGSYDLEIGFVKANTTAQNLFGTGNWANTKDSGIAVTMDQYTSTAFQIFVFNATNSGYARHTLAEANSQKYTEILVQKRKSGTVIKDLISGVSSSYSNYANPSDTYMAVGGTKGGGGNLVGYLRYLRIKKITEA